jgi:hypothetical protein
MLTITPAEYVMMQIQVRGEIKQTSTSRRDREIAKKEVDEILALNGITVKGSVQPLLEAAQEAIALNTPVDTKWKEGNFYTGESIVDQTLEPDSAARI